MTNTLLIPKTLQEMESLETMYMEMSRDIISPIYTTGLIKPGKHKSVFVISCKPCILILPMVYAGMMMQVRCQHGMFLVLWDFIRCVREVNNMLSEVLW